MTIAHKAGSIKKNADGFSRWELLKKPENPTNFPENAEPQITIEGINITDIGTESFEEVRESYKKDNKLHILAYVLDKDCKYTALSNSSEDI
ncbi:hypothetical protein O181_066475 [Austropuccinia psidii MF-1]|uniref:Uncharacterized protein n=1 Tax=Austropuccinia psidii MF-1 TaxID=1389203 RepID=A0A9Q3EX53_9BASI|nr:hypothetical protein [Austropuccinia psidii MF-1]